MKFGMAVLAIKFGNMCRQYTRHAALIAKRNHLAVRIGETYKLTKNPKSADGRTRKAEIDGPDCSGISSVQRRGISTMTRGCPHRMRGQTRAGPMRGWNDRGRFGKGPREDAAHPVWYLIWAAIASAGAFFPERQKEGAPRNRT